MGKLSIRAKITLWFAVALVIIVSLTYVVVLSAGDKVLQKSIRDNLLETVEHNVDEVEYFANIDHIDLSIETDYFLQYKEGYLEIDDDFLDNVNMVYTSLYLSDGTLLYGENPIANETSAYEFCDLKIQNLKSDGTLYYIFDRKLTADNLDGLWLRGIVSEEQGAVQMTAITRTSLILLPALMVITIIGGYLIAGRMLRPIRKISESASEISNGGDLKKRIEPGKSKDELYLLTNNFNDMFERLDNAFQTERRFTSDASHELRTPMAVIMAQCELTLEQECTAEEYKDALRVIERQGSKVTRIINDMLDFTRLELGDTRYEKVDIDLSKLTESVCEDATLIREQNITLEYKTEAGIECVGNRELLTRLLMNLISNAYRYGKENGTIYVELASKDGSAYISVKDNGIGISQDDLPKIFDRFYQADSSRTGSGTGLGLSIVKEIAKFHGGDISVQSTLGEGSCFTFSVPQKIFKN